MIQTIENKRNTFLFMAVSHNQCSRLPTDPARSKHIIFVITLIQPVGGTNEINRGRPKTSFQVYSSFALILGTKTCTPEVGYFVKVQEYVGVATFILCTVKTTLQKVLLQHYFRRYCIYLKLQVIFLSQFQNFFHSLAKHLDQNVFVCLFVLFCFVLVFKKIIFTQQKMLFKQSGKDFWFNSLEFFD